MRGLHDSGFDLDRVAWSDVVDAVVASEDSAAWLSDDAADLALVDEFLAEFAEAGVADQFETERVGDQFATDSEVL